MRSAVADVVRRQVEAGVDIVFDGEQGKRHPDKAVLPVGEWTFPSAVGPS